MPVTPNGTVYTEHETILPSGAHACLIVADAALGLTTKLMDYFHGNGGPFDQFARYGEWGPLRNPLLDRHVAIVELASAAGDLWGMEVNDHAEAVAWARTLVPGLELCVFGRSMGGLGAYRAAVEGPLASDIKALVINSGTTALRARYAVATGDDLIEMNTGWGIPGTSRNIPAFAIASAGHDPLEDYPLDAYEHLYVMQLWGDADTTVAPAVHGASWVAKYGDHVRNPPVTVDIRPGGDHSAGNGSYHQVTQMLDFFDTYVWPTPEPGPAYTAVAREAYVLGEGLRAHRTRPAVLVP